MSASASASASQEPWRVDADTRWAHASRRIAPSRKPAMDPSTSRINGAEDDLFKAVGAVKATLDHLGECAIADEATLKGHTDEFVKSLKAAHSALKAETDRTDLEPTEYKDSPADARMRSHFVAMRAGIMGNHIDLMIADEDEALSSKDGKKPAAAVPDDDEWGRFAWADPMGQAPGSGRPAVPDDWSSDDMPD